MINNPNRGNERSGGAIGCLVILLGFCAAVGGLYSFAQLIIYLFAHPH